MIYTQKTMLTTAADKHNSWFRNPYLPMLGGQSSTLPSSELFTSLENGFTGKRKRKPPGTPDPDAEVVSLSPDSLMESDRYVCEICNQGFQREQNLQMHRRRHKVPWKLLKRAAAPEVRKRVYVCPEPSCLHHDPCHALGDLVGIKKHYRRKHSNRKQWVCEKCSKGYAVQSDYKAHIRTCGTRGHSCDCGRVFSRVESFIEHQDACKGKTVKPLRQDPKPAYLLQTPAFSINTSTFGSKSPPPNSRILFKQQKTDVISPGCKNHSITSLHHNLKLRRLTSPSDSNPPPSSPTNLSLCTTSDKSHATATQLKLSIGSPSHCEKNDSNSSSLKHHDAYKAYFMDQRVDMIEEPLMKVLRLKDEAREQLRIAMEEKSLAEEKRRQANWQIEMAMQELTDAKKIREEALMELSKAQILKERTTKQIISNTLQITCSACKRQYQAITKAPVMASTLGLLG